MSDTRDWVEGVGRSTIENYHALRDTLGFAGDCFGRMIRPRNYRPVMRDVATMQIYFTAVQIVGFFVLVSVVFGSLFIGLTLKLMKDIGMMQYLGNFIAGIVVLEMGPLVTVLLVALRSGSAIDAEIAVMKVNRELDALRSFEIDIVNYLFIPRIIAVMTSVVLLSALFSIIVVASGFLCSSLLFGMSYDAYSAILIKAISLRDLFIMLVKASAFGFFIAFIPLYHGSRAGYELTSVPISVLKGMVSVFIAIIVIEVLSLVARFL